MKDFLWIKDERHITIVFDLVYLRIKILPNLCKGIARSKGLLILLAYAREILGDYCRGFDLQLLRQNPS